MSVRDAQQHLRPRTNCRECFVHAISQLPRCSEKQDAMPNDFSNTLRNKNHFTEEEQNQQVFPLWCTGLNKKHIKKRLMLL